MKLLLAAAAGAALTLAGSEAAAQRGQTVILPGPAYPAAAAPGALPTSNVPMVRPGFKLTCGDPQKDWVREWRNGRELTRQQALTVLRDIAYGRHDDPMALRCAVAELRALYSARGGRQQTFNDLSSTVVGLGGLGSLASTGAGQLTQSVWGYTALVPVMVSEFAAYDPTRDLFHGGVLALDHINARYATLQETSDALLSIEPETTRRTNAAEACRNADSYRSTIKKWTSSDYRTTYTAAADALKKACDEVVDADEYLGGFQKFSGLWRRRLGRLYAADVINLDTRLTANDHDLRSTPFETLTSIAAAPFEAASTLISGNNTKDAWNALKTQAAFNNLDMTLSTVAAPPIPRALSKRVELDGDVVMLANVARDQGHTNTKEVQTVSNAFATAVHALNRQRMDITYAAEFSTALQTAAKADQLKFNYDANTKKASVTLMEATKPAAVTPSEAR